MSFKHAVARRAKQLARFLGLNPDKTSHTEKWLAAAGALLSMLAVIAIGRHYAGEQGAAWLVASMGASAVLLFAVPHGPLSQPWQVIAGNGVSALIGVACAQWIEQPLFAAALAVSLAIGAMHYLRCIHPPGGATALTAVTGGEAVQALGFEYALTPVLLNAITMVVIAVAFNYFFAWRRYPASLAVRRPLILSGSAVEATTPQTAIAATESVGKADPVQKPAVTQTVSCNLSEGPLWQVRQVTVAPADCASQNLVITYHVVAGQVRHLSVEAALEDFARRASYESFYHEHPWRHLPWSNQTEQ